MKAMQMPTIDTIAPCVVWVVRCASARLKAEIERIGDEIAIQFDNVLEASEQKP